MVLSLIYFTKSFSHCQDLFSSEYSVYWGWFCFQILKCFLISLTFSELHCLMANKSCGTLICSALMARLATFVWNYSYSGDLNIKETHTTQSRIGYIQSFIYKANSYHSATGLTGAVEITFSCSKIEI